MSRLDEAALVLSGVLALLVVLLLVATGVGHTLRARRAARNARRRVELQPVVHALLDPDDGPAPPASTGTDPLLDELVIGLLPQLRGADRTLLQDVLVERGVVDRAAAQLTSRAAWRRGRAAELLGNVSSGAHVPQLVALLGDPVAEVRHSAARALGRTGEVTAVVPLLAALDARPGLPPGIVGMALLDLGTPALPELRVAVEGPVLEARALAAQLLGLHSDPVATDVLTRVLADADQPSALRLSAAAALGRIGSPQASPVLVSVLNSGRPLELREVAAEALGRIGDPSTLDALTAGLVTGTGAVPATCAEALTGFGRAGRERLDEHARRGGPVALTARAALDALDARTPRRRDPAGVAR